MKQSEVMVATEGDAYFLRNKSKPRTEDRILESIKLNNIKPLNVLEIGCGNGWRLQALRDEYKCDGWGVDASWVAIQEGRRKYHDLSLRVGTADCLGYAPNAFDVVVLGFFLYLLDREDLFSVVAQIDGVLQDKGYLIIQDFHADTPHSRAYRHDERLLTYKMDYSRLFTVNPAYSVVDTRILGTESEQPENVDDQVSVVVLRKDVERAWPRKT